MKYIFITFFMLISLHASEAIVSVKEGSVIVIRDNYEKPLFKGSPIMAHDKIKCANDGRVVLVFKDKTTVTLGPNSVFKVNRYVFNEKKQDISFKVVKGFFNVLTGEISKVARKKFELKTKNATIGIRGTEFMGVVEDDDMLIACTKGEILVSNSEGEESVKVGKITKVIDTYAPMPARDISEKDLLFFKTRSKASGAKKAAQKDSEQSGTLALYDNKNMFLAIDKKRKIGAIVRYKKGTEEYSYLRIKNNKLYEIKTKKQRLIKDIFLKNDKLVLKKNSKFHYISTIDYTNASHTMRGFVASLLFKGTKLYKVALGEDLFLDFEDSSATTRSAVMHYKKDTFFEFMYGGEDRKHYYVCEDMFGITSSDVKFNNKPLKKEYTHVIATPYDENATLIEKDLKNSTHWGTLYGKWKVKNKKYRLDRHSLWVGGENLVKEDMSGTKVYEVYVKQTNVANKREISTTPVHKAQLKIDYSAKSVQFIDNGINVLFEHVKINASQFSGIKKEGRTTFHIKGALFGEDKNLAAVVSMKKKNAVSIYMLRD